MHLSLQICVVKRKKLITRLGNAFESVVSNPESICEEIKNSLEEEIAESVEGKPQEQIAATLDGKTVIIDEPPNDTEEASSFRNLQAIQNILI